MGEGLQACQAKNFSQRNYQRQIWDAGSAVYANNSNENFTLKDLQPVELNDESDDETETEMNQSEAEETEDSGMQESEYESEGDYSETDVPDEGEDDNEVTYTNNDEEPDRDSRTSTRGRI